MLYVFYLFTLAAIIAAGGVSNTSAAEGSSPVAMVDDEIITLEEIEKPLSAKLAALNEQIYQLRRQRIDALIAERLLTKEAQRRGVTVEALLISEVTSKVPAITPGEIDAFYQTNEKQLPKDEPALRERIQAHLFNQKLLAQQNAFLGQLRAKSKIKILFDPPPVYRAPLVIEGAPFKGPADAQVVIVEFEDFHCPFCKESQRTMDELMARYPETIKIVHKDFPIDEIHPGARQAHLAGRCANTQGKFWPYHDQLFGHAPHAAPEDLKKYADAAGLNLAAFESCMTANKFAAAVQADIDEGVRAGVTGTPAFFINGRLIAGAQPLERFIAVIDEEIARGR